MTKMFYCESKLGFKKRDVICVNPYPTGNYDHNDLLMYCTCKNSYVTCKLHLLTEYTQ